MSRFLQKLRAYFYGRYGIDDLSKFMLILGLALAILSWIRPLRFISILSVILYVLVWLRLLSKNYAARRRELMIYEKVTAPIRKKILYFKNRWKYRKTHVYLKCPNCKATIRISRPAEKKKVRINCPRCKKPFEKQL